ncbi:hypothetical protein CEXT_550881 [Caerostris extrusa]|uniref:Uncharacterized protein n=1 Tax=Caerostris extrusa TaxID=172846 RepID=A0AAV4U3T7_CAEEX|nr:hypothetical protein CEXT_550881 [Caerostris extrusa]
MLQLYDSPAKNTRREVIQRPQKSVLDDGARNRSKTRVDRFGNGSRFVSRMRVDSILGSIGRKRMFPKKYTSSVEQDFNRCKLKQDLELAWCIEGKHQEKRNKTNGMKWRMSEPQSISVLSSTPALDLFRPTCLDIFGYLEKSKGKDGRNCLCATLDLAQPGIAIRRVELF